MWKGWVEGMDDNSQLLSTLDLQMVEDKGLEHG
jgi:hypothetical protein